jgi:O-antigen ligase
VAISRKRRHRPRPEPPASVPAKAGFARAIAVCEELAFALLLVAVALAFDRSIDSGYVLPKVVALRLLAPLVFAFAAYRLWQGPRPELPLAPMAASVALGVWWVVATVAAAHPYTSQHGMPGRYNGLWTQLTCLGLFVAAALAPDRAAAGRRRVVVVAALVPVAAYTLVQYFAPDPLWPSPRPPSTIGQPVQLSALLALALPFPLAGVFAARSRARAIVPALVAAVVAAAIAASLSRGPLVGAVAGGVLVLAAVVRAMRIRLAPVVIGVALVAAAGSVALLNPQRREGITERLRAFTNPGADPSVVGRLVLYRAAVRMTADHPLTGVGLENFGLLYPHYRPVEPASVPVDSVPSMVHDGYLHWAATTGVPGLLLYLLVLGAVAWGVGRACRRADDPRRQLGLAAFLAALSAYAVQDLSGWLDPALSVFFWTILGLAVASAGDDATVAVHPRGVPLSLAHRAAALVLIAAFVAATGPLPRTFAERRAARTLGAVQSAPDAALEAIVAELPDDAYHLERVGTELVRRFAERPERRSYLAAADRLDRAGRLNPFDAYVKVQRIRLEALAEVGPPALRPLLGAEDAVAAAAATDPNNPTVHVAIARLRYTQRRGAEARREAEHALRLRPGLPSALVVRADLEYSAGDARAAAATYAEAAAQLHPKDGWWLEAMLKQVVNLIGSGQLERAASVGEEIVRLKPDTATAHLLLGVTYGMRGDTARARTAYERTLLLDPGNERPAAPWRPWTSAETPVGARPAPDIVLPANGAQWGSTHGPATRPALSRPFAALAGAGAPAGSRQESATGDPPGARRGGRGWDGHRHGRSTADLRPGRPGLHPSRHPRHDPGGSRRRLRVPKGANASSRPSRGRGDALRIGHGHGPIDAARPCLAPDRHSPAGARGAQQRQLPPGPTHPDGRDRAAGPRLSDCRLRQRVRAGPALRPRPRLRPLRRQRRRGDGGRGVQLRVPEGRRQDRCSPRPLARGPCGLAEHAVLRVAPSLRSP